MQDGLNKLMPLLGPEGVQILAAQGPEAIGERLEAFSSHENALLEHLQQTQMMQTSFGGRAREWALTCGTSVGAAFPSRAELKLQLTRVFLPPNQAYRVRSRFLATRQGNKELVDFV
ncbi:uncharacterized protein PHALS_10249 [Plasmopara halstedii]|uniref:Retrotransposon gag domain n=1 Tax=Plasmopara halstedii TaxID=4781 RepID=A0A0P1AH84_PLAHL|nr:uncharacterized protein PHALS_10249 [Plasmopara halstedii]CEG40026.1 hypothetical protein PHALS_10249 [Plasmopara halstedii]|eukprot:XP_024576395.1 hypothetical protein PHALS_10249 [Plasmopara halstedii]